MPAPPPSPGPEPPGASPSRRLSPRKRKADSASAMNDEPSQIAEDQYQVEAEAEEKGRVGRQGGEQGGGQGGEQGGG